MALPPTLISDDFLSFSPSVVTVTALPAYELLAFRPPFARS
jgi:hypothetical protein